jgi:hypothetical protein
MLFASSLMAQRARSLCTRNISTLSKPRPEPVSCFAPGGPLRGQQRDDLRTSAHRGPGAGLELVGGSSVCSQPFTKWFNSRMTAFASSALSGSCAASRSALRLCQSSAIIHLWPRPRLPAERATINTVPVWLAIALTVHWNLLLTLILRGTASVGLRGPGTAAWHSSKRTAKCLHSAQVHPSDGYIPL